MLKNKGNGKNVTSFGSQYKAILFGSIKICFVKVGSEYEKLWLSEDSTTNLLIYTFIHSVSLDNFILGSRLPGGLVTLYF